MTHSPRRLPVFIATLGLSAAIAGPAAAADCKVEGTSMKQFTVSAPDAALCDKVVTAAKVAWAKAEEALSHFGYAADLGADAVVRTNAVAKGATGRATLDTRTKGDLLYATVKVVVPREGETEGRLAVDGSPHDWAHFERTLVHEFASVQLNLLLGRKADGYRLYDAPKWFYQGFPEHIASQHDVRRQEAYYRMVTAGTDDIYANGFVLVRALVNRLGADGVRGLLACPRRFESCLAQAALPRPSKPPTKTAK